jgi:hypothetical protein
MPEVAAPANTPRTNLDATPAPAKSKERTFTIPKALSNKGRRGNAAKIAAKEEAKFAKLNGSVDSERKARLANSRVTHSFKPTAQNLKDDSVVVQATPVEAAKPAEATPAVIEPPKKAEAKVDAPAAAVPEKPAAETVAAKVPVTSEELPSEYIRSLKAFGLSDADIASGLAAGPQMFMNVAKMLHAARTKEINDFANIGRAKGGQQVAVPPQPQQAATAAQGLRAVDIAAIAKKYNITDSALLNEIVGPVNQVIAQFTVMAEARQQQEIGLLKQQVDAFFASPTMKSYETEYSDAANRDKIIETASYILNGATQAGKQLSVEEALSMAHDATAAPKQRQQRQQAVVQATQQRAAALTHKPSGSTPTAQAAKPRSRDELYKAVGTALRRI